MLLPSSHAAALLLLVLSFVLLGSWANTLKLAGSRWRFELYYFDFAIGALVCGLLAAYTLGTLGPDLSFNDRIVVAGLRSQAMAIGSGFVFSLGNMLLLGAMTLMGMAASFPLVFSVAFIIVALFSISQPNQGLLVGGLVALLVAAVCAGFCQREPLAAKQSGRQRQPSARFVRRSTKAVIVSVIGGIFIGFSYPMAEIAFWGDLGLGAYAGALMFAIGIAISAAFFNLFLMNMAIEGPRLSFRSYLGGSARQHVFGLLGGFLFLGGLLASLLARSVPAAVQPSLADAALLTRGFVVLATLYGLFVWREKTPRGGQTGLLVISLLAYVTGIAALAFRF